MGIFQKWVLAFLIGWSLGAVANATALRPRGADDWTFERFAATLASGGATTVDAAIAALPEELRGRYVLMYRSRSLQPGTFAAPRAVLYEADGSFLLAFNGSSRAIETMQFRESERRWELREIQFSDAGAPVVSEPNPRRCLECHQSAARADVDPRPNWEPYDIWPGAYGGVDGRVGDTLTEANAPGGPRPEDAPIIADEKLEKDALQQFLLIQKPADARYRALGAFDPHRALELTDALVWNNDLRVARLAAATPDWSLFGDLYLESRFCSGDDNAPLPRSTPPELRAELQPAADAIAAQAKFGIENTHRMALLFGARGVDTSDWSMDFKTGGRFAFRDRFGSPSSPDAQMQSAFAEHFGFDPASACEDARARLQARLPALRASGELAAIASRAQAGRAAIPPPPAPESLLLRCARCHAGPLPEAPPLPFDDAQALRPLLGATGYPRGALLDEIAYRLGDLASFDEQMPPAGVLPQSDRQRLIEWLSRL